MGTVSISRIDVKDIVVQMSETISIEQVRTQDLDQNIHDPLWLLIVNDLNVLDILVNVTMIHEGAKKIDVNDRKFVGRISLLFVIP